MNNTTEFITNSTLGCLGTRDGDIGKVVQSSAQRLQTSSINNNMNPARGRQIPPVYSLPTPQENGYHSQLDATGAGVVNITSERTELNENDLRKKKEQVEKRIGKKSGFKVASFNIKGQRHNHKSKYEGLVAKIRTERIIVAALQETKLKGGDEVNIMNTNPKIIIESNPYDGESAKAGVAFALNKDMIANKPYSHTILIRGRASRLTINWSDDQGIDIINIYAPNEKNEKIEFYKELKRKIDKIKDWNNPLIMGDMNMTEKSEDRAPESQDDEKVRETFKEIIKKFKANDGWRISNPGKRQFTFSQRNNRGKETHARIDRIYVTQEMYAYSYDWKIQDVAGTASDHQMITVSILKNKLPYIGDGLWKLYEDTIEYNPFRKRITKLLKETEEKMNNITQRTRENNPQIIWEETKIKIKKIAKEEVKKRTKLKYKKVNNAKEKLSKELAKLNDQAMQRVIKTRVIDERKKLEQIETEMLQKKKIATKARYKKEGEKGTKYWFGLNKVKFEKTIINAMEDKEGILTTKTKEMVKIASEYHRALQKEPTRTEENRTEMQTVVDEIDTQLNDEQKELFEKGITIKEIKEALKNAGNGVAPGKDGLPYEFYKSIPEPEGEDDDEGVSISNILHRVYRDIETFGKEKTEFSIGVMYLLYKKKEKTKIENYRPVTLTNADYKLLTKTIATKLGKVAGNLIHPNQAGFIPGRGLYDNTKLSELVIQYCEQEEIEGYIVSLDQEKAYDKIAHDYLWKVLEKYGFPEKFITMIKSIYGNAETIIMVNGVLPTPIKVQRGVRQGCPMSCLIYNLAIEPLAIMIRKSKLKGIEIRGLKERILVTLFADDTLVYMRKSDDMKTLNKIINRFCDASTAKFNLEKTEYLPIGPIQYRKQIEETRKLNEMEGNEIKEGMTIITEGKSMRTLGAWVGNNANQNEQWEKILNKQKEVLSKWAQTRPTLKGKELILKALIQSRALFLATVNGMPLKVEKEMKSIIKDFVWNEKKQGLILWEKAIQPREYGGLNMPDIETRNEAIDIMWLKKWQTHKEDKPAWAYVADELVRKNVAQKPIVDENTKIDWAIQTWNENGGRTSRLPDCIKRMIKVYRKYNAGITAQKMSKETKEQLPIWYHIATNTKYIENKKAARCLRKNHKIMTVGDAEKHWNDEIEAKNCKTEGACRKILKILRKRIPKKLNPINITPHKDGLDHTPSRIKKHYRKEAIEGEPTLINPDITERGKVKNSIRIFTKEKKYKHRKHKDESLRLEPAYRDEGTDDEKITVYTDGSSTNNGSENTRAGAGIWVKDESPLNKAIRIKRIGATNQEAELIAVMEALKIKGNLKIKTDSMYVRDGIIKNISEWEDIAWLNIDHADLWKEVIKRIRKRGNTTEIEWVKGHSGEEGNTKADELARIGTEKNRYTKLKIREDEQFDVNGARLSKLTQSIAYGLLIRDRREKRNIKDINYILEDAQDEIERTTGFRPKQKELRIQTDKGEVDNKIKDFVWRMQNNVIRCGLYFNRIPGWEEKKFCKCGEIESIEHIILDCKVNKSKKIWKKVKKLWKKISKEDGKWINPTKGILSGIQKMRIIKGTGEKRKISKTGTQRYKIMVSETMWLLWKNRNHRIFNEEVRKTKDIMKIWRNTMTNRILIDWNVIKLETYAARANEIDKFQQVWKDIIIVNKEKHKIEIKL